MLSFQSLFQLCTFAFSDIEEDVRSLAQFTTEVIVAAVARCLKTINNDLDPPHKLPPSMSARFRVGTTLANGVAVSSHDKYFI